jgi:hypothetical protein
VKFVMNVEFTCRNLVRYYPGVFMECLTKPIFFRQDILNFGLRFYRCISYSYANHYNCLCSCLFRDN